VIVQLQRERPTVTNFYLRLQTEIVTVGQFSHSKEQARDA